ncbi:hypothetical protein DAPPUDRAFT_112049 [Daphnia pulex]|uniref:Uncharacterized protein n=1 Tax=Daphnia pulex TaxID=6669 RepID=E9HAT5_DAPPU|nr:hypothetical protein DAPPUDRAFT_112049 [Daphnia pulex]|eukprot:EFX71160.1 hypothetical protein DAPPUDRAFT_112049 [Daphnia pulex]
MAASNGVSTGCYDSTHGELCSTWINLEWCLMAVCVLAAIDSIVLIALTSDLFCCSNDNNATVNTVGHQVVIGTGDIGIGNSQQPVDVKQPPMQLNAQQLLIQSRQTPQPVSATAPSALAQAQQH